MSAPDLTEPILAALRASSVITALLPTFKGGYPIFTRRPTPDNAPYPMIVISPDVALTDNDGVDDYRPVVVRDLAAYGQNDTATKYRAVETLGYAMRALFHAQRHAIIVTGWNVINITAQGPIPGPTDDDATAARIVSLTVELSKLA